MSNRALLPFSKMTGLLSIVSLKLESVIVKKTSESLALLYHCPFYAYDWILVFCKRMPTGQNPVQPMTQAAKYYKSLSLLLLSFLPRERLVASPKVQQAPSFHAQVFSGRGKLLKKSEYSKSDDFKKL